MSNKKIWATLSFDLKAMGEEGLKHLFKAEGELRKVGIHFDTGCGCGYRDWELDWSLKGAELRNPREVEEDKKK